VLYTSGLPPRILSTGLDLTLGKGVRLISIAPEDPSQAYCSTWGLNLL
jgi:hypothetical protein